MLAVFNVEATWMLAFIKSYPLPAKILNKSTYFALVPSRG